MKSESMPIAQYLQAWFETDEGRACLSGNEDLESRLGAAYCQGWVDGIIYSKPQAVTSANLEKIDALVERIKTMVENNYSHAFPLRFALMLNDWEIIINAWPKIRAALEKQ